jgi:hypothetical protein
MLPRLPALTHLASVASLSLASLALAGCGNTPPSVDAFTVTAPVKGADGNYSMTATLTVSDADQDKIPRVDISATGPAVVPTQSLTIPGGAAGTYPISLKLAGNAPAGTYTLSAVAYDEPGGASEAKTATFTLPSP